MGLDRSHELVKKVRGEEIGDDHTAISSYDFVDLIERFRRSESDE